jgi:replicative DNA helicase
MTRDLKGLAKELKVPIIQVSQLSRQVEIRGGSKRPQLSDLRESGAIEQDSDLVTFIYRPEYYQIFEDENGNSTKGLAEIIIAKFRNGEPGTVLTRFVKERTEFQYDATLDDDCEDNQIQLPF